MGQSENALEKELIEQLLTLGFEKVAIKNEESLLQNLKKQLEIHNKTQFTKREFQRILNHLNSGSRFEKAKKLRDRYLLQRDDGTELYIRFIDTDSWCKNIYQVTNQVSINGKRKNRYDVTLLINGLPLVQIELKRRGAELKEAFNQIQRYHKESFSGTLYEYVQIFVISNGVNTKYFANNPKQSFEQTFYWSDEKNNPIKSLPDFTNTFLEKCHLSKMIAKYIVLAEAKKIPMVLRPYQYYAVEKIVKRVKESNKNGYIWHTTGSGKTVTSFKVSQLLTAIPEIKKVIFVVDRKDLDIQTTKEFNSFSDGSVDGTEDTKTLVKQLKDPNTKLIVTTIQKLSIAIEREHYLKQFKHLRDEKVILIFDECHRSQFGKTHANIRRFFNNAQLFGFTGTPIFKQNKVGNATTASVFDECLHKYLITNAISDKNVLGFSVEYIGKYTKKDPYSQIEEKIDVDINNQVMLENPKRLEKIVDYILSIHKKKTKNKTFNSIFAVSNTKVLKEYYKLFKKKKHDLTIATIFSFKANEEEDALDTNVDRDENNKNALIDTTAKNALDEYIKEYNERFSTNFSTEKFYDYYKDVQKRVKNGEIDILIVVNMFLTGFDAPKLNTLYVDKNLSYHGLIQAYSRTNRLFNAKKPHGNIVCFRNLKEDTDEALKLFGDENAKDIVFKKPYEKIKEKFEDKVKELKSFVPTVEDVDKLRSEKDKKKFVIIFRDLMRIHSELETYVEFSFDDVCIDEQKYLDYRSKYFDIYEHRQKDDEVSGEIEDIDFSLELIHTDIINYDYIINLLSDIKEAEGTLEYNIKKEEFFKKLEHNIQYRDKRELIKRFIEEDLPKIKNKDDIKNAFDNYWNKEKEKFIEELAIAEGMDIERLKTLIQEFFYTRNLPKSDIIVNTLKQIPKVCERPKVAKRIKEKLEKFINVFEEYNN